MKAEINEKKAGAVGRQDLWEQFKHRQKLGAIWLTTREVDGNLIPSWESIGQEDDHSNNLILQYREIISHESFPQDRLIKALKEAATPALLARKGKRGFIFQNIEKALLTFIERGGIVPEEGINEKTALVVRGRNRETIDEWHGRIIKQIENSNIDKDLNLLIIQTLEYNSLSEHTADLTHPADKIADSPRSLESKISFAYSVEQTVSPTGSLFESSHPDWTARIWLAMDPAICLEHDRTANVSGAEIVTFGQAIQSTTERSLDENTVDSGHLSREVTFEAGWSNFVFMPRMDANSRIVQALSAKTGPEQIDLANFVITINHSSVPLSTHALLPTEIGDLHELMKWAKGRQVQYEAENRLRIAEVQALSDRLAEMDFKSTDRAQREEVVAVFNDLLRKADAVVVFHDAKDEKTPWKRVLDISCILTSSASKGAIRFRGVGRSELSRKSSWPYGCKVFLVSDLDTELESLNFKS